MDKELVCFAALAMLAACNSPSSPPGGRPPTPDEIPESVAIPGGPVELGVALGKPRTSRRIESFTISKTPITVARYKECIAAGQCTTPQMSGGACEAVRVPVVEGKTFDAPSRTGDLPITCVSPQQAAEYCAWVGGALPTVGQWMYAARGATVRRFAWGDDAPDCNRNPRAISPEREPGGCCSPSTGCDPTTYYAVAQRTDAASPFGVLDVLSTPSELLRGSNDSTMPACQRSGGACAVQGIVPGAIDFVANVTDDIQQPVQSERVPAYGFRCVHEVSP